MQKFILTLFILVSVVIGGYAQEKLKIGELVDGKLKITNESGLKAFLMNSLNKSGSLDREIKTEISPAKDRIFIYQKVTGNKSGIRTIGVMLVVFNHEVFIVAADPDSPPGLGGSATISCVGNPCNSCYPSVQWAGNWLPVVTCECNEPEGLCNMTVTFTVSINVG